MPSAPTSIRTLLVLGRVSNLPTIWSNCLAGWLLGGAGSPGRLVGLCLGASLLYVAGMYLNDAFDAEFDRQHRRTRPIPSGAIPEGTVWRIGWALLGAGMFVVATLGIGPAVVGVLLAGAILIYDATHKALAVSPLLMALCRFLLYLLAAATGARGIGGPAIWGGVALGGWIVGLSYVAKRESTTGRLPRWPLTALALPLFFAIIILVTVFGRNIFLVFLAIGAVEWLTIARIVRGQTLAAKQMEYVEAARSLGAPASRIVLRHIVPNVVGPVIVFSTLLVPTVILVESFLSFLGLGVQEPQTSWGLLISQGTASLDSAPWLLVIPAAFLAATMFAFNFIGDGLRDALDPRDET